MAEPDENPFGDPHPFQDPSVKELTTNKVQSLIEDFNPFGNDQNVVNNSKPAVRGAANPPLNSMPAVMSPTQEYPVTSQIAPNYSRSTGDVSADLLARKAELDRRQAELDKREEELRNASINVRQNNWPPLPKQCCYQPCFYLDINVEIPPDFQHVVRQLYYMWLYHTGLLAANVVMATILLFFRGALGTFVSSIIYTAALVPLSFLCWFRPGYKAFRDDSSFNFMLYFFVFCIQFVITIVQALGSENSGYCGLFTAISIYKGPPPSPFLGTLVLMLGIAFTIGAVMDFFLLTKIHKIYRSSGASFAKAQEEFRSGVISSGAVGNVISSNIRF
ncbi:secretory carrier-associated membrane protein 1 isoform X1 [Daktulosphaira vitifoliae]|uniref:secretory carrier-associated membrane protein 1 isoform X1 n=1 Tax=Daktulosphaira vitifoliae TaxID=58002 RepID=UPI0021AAC477|nr:secretory carrier-associated membrane protein 1 isoform X1 [Daktulosphaira vitifoliae]